MAVDGPWLVNAHALNSSNSPDHHATCLIHAQVPPEVLEWEYRMPLMLAEVAESEADVICIQVRGYTTVLSRSCWCTGAARCK